MSIGIHSDTLSRLDTYLKLGLRAQSQSRANIETLTNMKKLPAELIKQTNIAHGPQQVNNHARPEESLDKQKTPNEQLEKTDGQRLEGGTLQEAVRSNQTLATVGTQVQGQDKGKNKASQNAYKGSVRPMLREITRVLREQESQLGEL